MEQVNTTPASSAHEVEFPPPISSHEAESPPPIDDQPERRKFMKRLQLDSEHSLEAQKDGFLELKKAPLFSLSVKEKSTVDTNARHLFPSYALLGHILKDSSGRTVAHSDIDFVLLNTNHPWSAFLCGLQGSGKSHTMSCMLENCLYPSEEIGKLPQPLAGLVFNWDNQAGNICQAAYLSTIGIEVNVFVSPSNYLTMRDKYHNEFGDCDNLKVLPYFLPADLLNKERMVRLMAFEASAENPPLYMQIIDKTIRTMAMETQGSSKFKYDDGSRNCFKTRILEEITNPQQSGPLNQRLDLLDSFLSGGAYERLFKRRAKYFPRADPETFLAGKPACLTVIDLTGTSDAETACLLFDISLSVFLEKTNVPKVVALDEAHNYLRGGAAATNFIQALEKTIRLGGLAKRHK